MKKPSLPEGLSFSQLLASIALPGFAFFPLGRRTVGRFLVAAYALCAVVFLAALGFTAGSIAFGLLVSIHATSVIFLEGLWLGKERIGRRLVAAFCTLVGLWGLAYSPALHFVEEHWFMPLRIGANVFVVNRTGANSIHRGDWVAYRISGERASLSRAQGSNIVMREEGYGIQQVLGVPGDRISYKPNMLLVNEQSMPSLAYMPQNGDFVVREKVWFIWPALSIDVHGRVAEADLSAAFQTLALVPEEEILGKAFKSWFGRKQSL